MGRSVKDRDCVRSRMAHFFNVTLGMTLLCTSVSNAVDAPPDLFTPVELVGVGDHFSFPAARFSYFSSVAKLESADIDLDGDMDVVVLADGGTSSSEWTASPPGSYVCGAVSCPGGVPATLPQSVNVTVGIIGDPSGSTYSGSDLAWFENNGFGGFLPHFITPAGNPALICNAKNLAVSDLNGDNRPDIITFSNDNGVYPGSWALGAGTVRWFENKGGGNFEDHLVYSGVAPRAGTVGDLNQDGFRDILFFEYQAAQMYWYLNDGSENFIQAKVDAGLGGSILNLIATDFDGDGKTDILYFRNSGVNGMGLLKCLNPAALTYSNTIIDTTFTTVSASTGDFNNDGLPDIVAGGRTDTSPSSPLSVFLTNDGTFTSWTRVTLPNSNLMGSRFGETRAVDMNNDGWLDVVSVANHNKFSAGLGPTLDSQVAIWINRSRDDNASGRVDPGELSWDEAGLAENFRSDEGAYWAWGGLAISDFDGDGDRDIMKSGRHWPMVFFENNWNRARTIRITAETTKNGVKRKTTSYLSTRTSKLGGVSSGESHGSK